MKKAKKILLMAFIFSQVSNLYGDEILNKFDRAKSFYQQGKIQESSELLTQIQNNLRATIVDSSADEYLEVSWDRIKILPDQYIGKKVKIIGTFISIGSSGNLVLSDVSTDSYEESLIETILTLEILEEYTFWGVVKEKKYGGPTLHVERIN